LTVEGRTTRLLAYTDAQLWGGAEESLAGLVSALDNRFDVSVVGVDRTVLDRVVRRRPGANSYLVPPFGGKLDVRSLWAHLRAFRAARPDICHLNLRVPSSCQAGLFAAALTTPFRIVVVEQLPLPSRSGFVRRWRRWASRLYGAHVAVGEASARAIEREFGLLPGSVRAVHNGIVPAVPAARAMPGGGRVIGTLGRLVPQKGHDVLVEALTELPDARAVIVGEGPSRAELEQLARRLGVDDRLELPGWSDDAPGYLPTFDVFVLPSRDEGLPLAMLEAMLAGVPVVASDVGSIREAIEHDRSGMLVPAGDPHALAVAVRLLLDDAELRARLAEAARTTVSSSFTAQVMASRYEQIYDEVLA